MGVINPLESSSPNHVPWHHAALPPDFSTCDPRFYPCVNVGNVAKSTIEQCKALLANAAACEIVYVHVAGMEPIVWRAVVCRLFCELVGTLEVWVLAPVCTGVTAIHYVVTSHYQAAEHHYSTPAVNQGVATCSTRGHASIVVVAEKLKRWLACKPWLLMKLSNNCGVHQQGEAKHPHHSSGVATGDASSDQH